ncbi:serine/threonine-protein kinase [Streptomyces sp. NPDC058662]|uniref:serine/threonine-protein kinase n=1 Tax=Streptomyces sp. NPDC058662 TaxID=3346583 RepID=UPI003650A204
MSSTSEGGEVRQGLPHPAGLQLAGYELQREIGRGPSGVVCIARDIRLDRKVALKLLDPDIARNEILSQNFIRDSRLASSIDHPHIAPIFDVGEDSGILYIAMRYIAGLDLEALLARDGPLSVAASMRIAGHLASAIDSAHARGLVHKNVHPGSILVIRSSSAEHPDYAYLAGFGIDRPALTDNFTSIGPFTGTLGCMAPEQITGDPVNGAADVYALACTVHETLTGEPVFLRDGDPAQLSAHQYDEPPRLSQRRPDITPQADHVMRTALSKSPGDRYHSCRQFVEELHTVIG